MYTYTPRRTKLQFKIIFEEDPVPIASEQQYHLYYSNTYIYFLKRKFTENVLQNTPNCTIDKKSGEYAHANTPKYSVRSNTISIIFVYKK